MNYNDGSFNSKMNEIKNRATEIQNFCYKFDEYSKGGFKEIASKIETKKVDLDEPLYVMIVGDGNRGKSTLLNGLFSKEIADVSLIPKTWKIDVFQSTDKENYAELEYVRNGKVSKERYSFEKAKEICKEKESENEKNKNVESWQSDLRCAKWYVKSEWPGREIAIVDTPGFSQLRADTSLKNINLFGASGIQLTRNDGFSYYYYRANVVLWCIDSGKLQDGEALEKLKEVNKEKKTIIGIITKMDKISLERWNETLEKAKETFGAYIDKFLFSAAGAKDEKLKAETIKIIRKEIEQLTKEKGQTIKIEEARHFIDERVDEIDNIITKSGNVFAENCIIYNDIFGKIESGVNNHYSKLKSDVVGYLKTNCKEALLKVDNAYDNCGGSEENFKRNIDSAIGSSKIAKKVEELVNSNDLNLKRYIDNLFNSAKWQTAIIGTTYSNNGLILQNENSKSSVITGRTISNISMSDSYAGVGVGVGIASALAGAAVLGPIGLLAGGIGYLVAKFKQRSDWTQRARNAIENVFENIEKEFLKNISDNKSSRERAYKNNLEKIFCSLNGGTVNEIEQRLYMMDKSLNSINKNTTSGISFFFDRMSIGHSKFYYKLLKIFPQKREEQKKNAECYLRECFNTIINKKVEPIKKQILAMKVMEFSYVNPLCNQIGFSGFPEMREIYKENEAKTYGITEQLNNDMLTLGLNLNLQSVLNRVSEEKLESLMDSYDDIVNKWDSKVYSGITKYIETLVEKLVNFENAWDKECNRILAERDYKSVDLFDFRKYFGKYFRNDMIAQKIYNYDKSVIKKEIFDWKYSDGSSCDEDIIDVFKGKIEEFHEKINKKSCKYKNNWDRVLVDYCKEKIKQKFRLLKSDPEYFSVKEISRGIAEPLSNHVSTEESLISRHDRLNLMKYAETVFDYVDKLIKEKFSDEKLTNDFVNDDILKTIFYTNLKGKQHEICENARKGFVDSIVKNLRLSKPSVTPTKDSEIILAICLGILEIPCGIGISFVYDPVKVGIVIMIVLMAIMCIAEMNIKGKYCWLLILATIVPMFFFSINIGLIIMICGSLYALMGILFIILNKMYHKEVAKCIVNTEETLIL